nr:MAG TPA: hypothetical protein [Caudoviricetes sp.]
MTNTVKKCNFSLQNLLTFIFYFDIIFLSFEHSPRQLSCIK